MSGAAAALIDGPAPLAIATTGLPTPVYNTAYSETVATSGAVGAVTFSISAGALPAGLSIGSMTGTISGTPTTPGAYGFTVKATDVLSRAAIQAYSGTIADPAITITTASLPNPTQYSAYSETVSATGGAGAYTWSISAGSLPSGLSIGSSTGTISGTPTGTGAPSFTVECADGYGDTATKSYSVTVSSAGSITVGVANILGNSIAGYIPADVTGSSITPTTLGGATIADFYWVSASGGYSVPGDMYLILDGNTGTGTHSATVNGVAIGASGAGSYSSGPNQTTYEWVGVSNPFGSTQGATLPCGLL